ncbi:hypothetical protein RIF29_27443 [Crotalaria pallida]|uniref:Uncharacterized protein n=1 Tax=Crotalaria pallida TaxID=3830 RepID=A0AAN9EQ10_CROPI
MTGNCDIGNKELEKAAVVSCFKLRNLYMIVYSPCKLIDSSNTLYLNLQSMGTALLIAYARSSWGTVFSWFQSI